MHSIADAEAAIRRAPTSVEQLSMAADLLIDLGDPRGEDFAACLNGRLSGEELQRRHPACTSAMFVAALAMSGEACSRCEGSGFTTSGGYDGTHGLDGPECEWCNWYGDRRNEAEALRLLAECGRVGSEHHGYWSDVLPCNHGECVPVSWWDVAIKPLHRNHQAFHDRVRNRVALIDAYANADAATRQRWSEETRRLATPRAEDAK